MSDSANTLTLEAATKYDDGPTCASELMRLPENGYDPEGLAKTWGSTQPGKTISGDWLLAVHQYKSSDFPDGNGEALEEIKDMVDGSVTFQDEPYSFVDTECCSGPPAVKHPVGQGGAIVPWFSLTGNIDLNDASNVTLPTRQSPPSPCRQSPQRSLRLRRNRPS